MAGVWCLLAALDLGEVAAGETGRPDEQGRRHVLKKRQNLALEHGRVGRTAVVGGFPFLELSLPSGLAGGAFLAGGAAVGGVVAGSAFPVADLAGCDERLVAVLLKEGQAGVAVDAAGVWQGAAAAAAGSCGWGKMG